MFSRHIYYVRKYFLTSISFVLTFGLLLVVGSGDVFAAQFTKASIRYDRMKAATLSTLQVVIVPVTTASEAKVRIVFGSATLGAGQSATTANTPSGAVGLPGTLVATGAGTSILVTGLTDLTVGTTYSFNLTVGVTTPGAGSALDTVTTLTAGDSAVDTTTVLSRYITDDQIVVTANVPPTFTFTLSGNTDTFTTDLSSSAIAVTNGRTVSVATNAAKGWIGWVKSDNTALSSVTTGESIGTTGTVDTAPSVCQVNSDCYVLDADLTTTGAGSGSLTIDAEYLGVGTSDGGTLSTTFQPFAKRTGKTAGDVITLIEKASMIATKAAGSDYTDTLTVVGAGSF
ncbi:hypothetical protein KBC75_03895 [Candidatus Shapirobacteria bacterium]|nr:hypothetical protein [Candidatus Shapirobacteria bacterium]